MVNSAIQWTNGVVSRCIAVTLGPRSASYVCTHTSAAARPLLPAVACYRVEWIMCVALSDGDSRRRWRRIHNVHILKLYVTSRSRDLSIMCQSVYPARTGRCEGHAHRRCLYTYKRVCSYIGHGNCWPERNYCTVYAYIQWIYLYIIVL